MSDDFTALPVTEGVGDYHFNRFRVVFMPPAGVTKEQLAGDFVNNFPRYFTSQYANVVFHGDHTYQGCQTLEFHGIVERAGMDLARPHNDWVARIWSNPNIGFTAQTLKREFWESGEDLAAAGGSVATGAGAGGGVGFLFGGIGAGPGALVGAGVGLLGSPMAVHWNRMHFLAGRRSWRLDDYTAFGIAPQSYLEGALVLETVAVERFSSRFFMVGDAVMGLENMIPSIWIANLSNFVRMRQLQTVYQDLRPNWRIGDVILQIKYYVDKSETLTGITSSPEFLNMRTLYPTILP